MMTRHFLGVFARSLVISLLAIAPSLFVVRLLHNALHLGAPPANGIILISLGVVFTCIGAALCGAIIGVFTGRKPGPWRGIATFLGLVWGTGAVLWIVPTYGSIVAEDLARQAGKIAWQKRDQLLPQAKDAVTAFRNGQGDHAKKQALEATRNFSNVGVEGAARLPALLLLGWAIILSPLLAFWECRQARRLS